MRIAIIVLAAGLAGCSWGKPALVVEMNGRRLEFESFESGKVPRGLEVTRFDPSSIQVSGEKPIEVNGLPVLVDGDEVNIGGRKISVDRDARVLVDSDGQIQVLVPSKPPAPTAVPPAAAK
jgi:hypothetical protein